MYRVRRQRFAEDVAEEGSTVGGSGKGGTTSGGSGSGVSINSLGSIEALSVAFSMLSI